MPFIWISSTLGNRQKWVPLPLDPKGQDTDQLNSNHSPDPDGSGPFSTRKSPSWRGVSPGGRGGRGRRGAGGMYRGGRGRQRGGGRGAECFYTISDNFSIPHITKLIM